MVFRRYINRFNCIFKLNNMQNTAQNGVNYIHERNIHNTVAKTYEAAIDALNGLQSNMEYIRNVRKQLLTYEEEYKNTILKMNTFITRSGLQLKSLESLSVIHVTGTKGKGSTCAFCESILRHHGYSTGFFSSPHLVEVRERIRLNGEPISKRKFAEHFWEIYDNLQETNKDHSMPIYFQILTIVALKVFLAEKIDVAIIEVGIGGEFDSTNIISNVPIVGITSLGLDHTALLGDTIEKIAWHKAGIMKKGCKAFTVPQPQEAMDVFKIKEMERHCSLKVVSDFTKDFTKENFKMPEICSLNVSLSVALAESWINLCGKNGTVKNLFKSETTRTGLLNCFWPGRFQILSTNDIVYYLDGAHTEESISFCIEWFIDRTKQSNHKKALIFNVTGNRSSEIFCKKLQAIYFNKVFFVPNVASSVKTADNVNFNVPESQQLSNCANHKKTWIQMCKENNNIMEAQDLIVLPTIFDALEKLHDGSKYDLLVTGSLHLVGSVLSIIDPELNGYQNMICRDLEAKKS